MGLGDSIAADGLYLLVGLGLLVFTFLNVRYELARRLVKRLGWLGQPPFSLNPDSKFGRVYYGSVISVFTLVIGLGWTIIPLLVLLHHLGR